MSNGHWRTDKRTEPFAPGRCATERVLEYERTWKARCYLHGIPDEVPQKVAASGRAPSWRAVALALLQNDLHLYQLGYARPAYERQCRVVSMAQIAMHGQTLGSRQLELFG
jgi:predicted phosphoadenosine phosphosulfate sulfurtransferase